MYIFLIISKIKLKATSIYYFSLKGKNYCLKGKNTPLTEPLNNRFMLLNS